MCTRHSCFYCSVDALLNKLLACRRWHVCTIAPVKVTFVWCQKCLLSLQDCVRWTYKGTTWWVNRQVSEVYQTWSSGMVKGHQCCVPKLSWENQIGHFSHICMLAHVATDQKGMSALGLGRFESGVGQGWSKRPFSNPCHTSHVSLLRLVILCKYLGRLFYNTWILVHLSPRTHPLLHSSAVVTHVAVPQKLWILLLMLETESLVFFTWNLICIHQAGGALAHGFTVVHQHDDRG